MKKIICLTMSTVILATACGCENKPGVNANGEFSPKDAIKIEDLDWHINGSFMDGERSISLDYTNNSAYTVMQLDIKFTLKPNITSEELKVFDDLKERWNYSDDEIKKFYILGSNRKCADPGETVTDSTCTINGTWTKVEDMSQYEMTEPDMATIAFIGVDGKGYVIYYDFKSGAYGESSKNGRDLHQWSDSEISALLPKREFKATQISTDREDRFFFYAFGVSEDEYEEYVAAVRANGFDNVQFEGSSSYRALNSNNIEANITYNAVEETMSGCVEKR